MALESVISQVAGMSTQPSTEELNSLSLACSRLWQLDVNRAQPGRDYQLNVQVCLTLRQMCFCQHAGLIESCHGTAAP